MVSNIGRGIVLFIGLTVGFAAAAADVAVDDVLAEVAAAGLPVSEFQAKVLEGRAKAVPEHRIAAVLEQMHRDFQAVRELLPEADGASLAAGAAALRAGSTEAGVVHVAEAPQALRSRALRTYADVLHGGLPQPQAVALLDVAIRAGNPSAALTGLAVASTSLVDQSYSPEAIVELLTGAISSGRAPAATLPKGKPK